MSYLYIHIPFCAQKCHYCDFYKTTKRDHTSHFIEAVKKEFVLRRSILTNKLKTIYFGGGTPSLISAQQYQEILHLIDKYHTIDPTTEITIEANPDDITENYISDLKHLGINRISIGVQSFDNTYLQKMNRRHDVQAIHKALKVLDKLSFTNFSLDLIYGLPEQTVEHLQGELSQLIDCQAPHLATYHLTYHPDTVFYSRLKRGSLKEVHEEVSIQQFELIHHTLTHLGYEHYELSNFAQPLQHSRHNSAYWENKKYLGLGPGAHSYDGISRFWNPSNLQVYIHTLCIEKKAYVEEEKLTERDYYNDLLITRLRTRKGIHLNNINIFSKAIQEHFQKVADGFIKQGIGVIRGNYLSISWKYWMLLDYITERFYYESQ